jgi:hypothetical protein
MRFQIRQLYWILTGLSFAMHVGFYEACRRPEGAVKAKKTIDPAIHLRDDDIKPEEFSTFPFGVHEVVKWLVPAGHKFRSSFDSWRDKLHCKF